MISDEGVLATDIKSRRKTRLTSLSLFAKAISSLTVNVLTMAEAEILWYILRTRVNDGDQTILRGTTLTYVHEFLDTRSILFRSIFSS